MSATPLTLIELAQSAGVAAGLRPSGDTSLEPTALDHHRRELPGVRSANPRRSCARDRVMCRSAPDAAVRRPIAGGLRSALFAISRKLEVSFSNSAPL